MLYLIGLGLNKEGFSFEAYHAAAKCDKLYCENYTIAFPYDIKDLEKDLENPVVGVDRMFVESLKFVEEAKKKDVGLLIYGSPLSATTHTTIIEEARKKKVKIKVIYGASVFDAIAETGLQMYKFGKTASLPQWDTKRHFEPDSFLDLVQQNLSIDAHTLLLVDIGLKLDDALNEIEESCKRRKLKLSDKLVVCSHLGLDDQKIVYGTLDKLRKLKLNEPFCFIIPGKLHFAEKEMLEEYGI